MKIEVGTKESEIYNYITKGKDKIVYPHFTISLVNKGLPISETDVGKTLSAIVELKVISTERKVVKNKKQQDWGFNVISINFNNKKKSVAGLI